MPSLFLSLLQIVGICHAFAPRSASLQTSIAQHDCRSAAVATTALSMTPPPDRSNHDEIVARNAARTDVRNLLTQRSIQSFMFLAEECRDPHTGKWIEEFLSCRNLARYHGCGALDVDRFRTWDSPLVEMMGRPKDVVIVSAKRRGKGHGGWSKDNPYMEDRYVEFEIDIDPVSLASRIISVREQIASEWVNDLRLLREANEQILDSYFTHVRTARDGGGDDLADGTFAARDGANGSVDPPSAGAFDRVAANILANYSRSEVGASSPFRRGNFDLLYNLATQEGVHRLIRNLRDAGEAKQLSHEWLRDYYVDRVAEYFDGDQSYGRADDFIERLLLTSPSVIYTDDGKMGLADPLGLAEQLIRIRSAVVDEWKETMETVPQDHNEIRKVVLSKQMGAWGLPGEESGGFQ